MIIDDKTLDQSVENLRQALLKALVQYSCSGWTVISKREHLDFQFECRYADKMRKTASLDFTMAKSEKEWLKILDAQAKMVVREISIMAGEFPPQWYHA